jgi:hypothetical protein
MISIQGNAMVGDESEYWEQRYEDATDRCDKCHDRMNKSELIKVRHMLVCQYCKENGETL